MNSPSVSNSNLKSIWTLRYTAKAKVQAMSNLDFNLSIDRISLNKSIIPHQNLVELSISSDSDNRIRIDSTFQYKLKKNGDKYRILYQEDKLHNLSNEYLTIMANYFHEHVNDVFLSLLNYITWRKKLKPFSPENNLEITECNWTLDNGNVNTYDGHGDARRVLDVIYFTSPVLEITENDFADYYSVLEKEKAPRPLYHELLEEAERLLWLEHYRSGYLAMYSALEVASKSIVREKLPEVEWLIEFEKTPPLINIYKEYINLYIAPLLTEDEYQTITNMATTRNNVAHRGGNVTFQTFYKHQLFVRKKLYQIDAQFGYSWALP